MLSTIRTGPKGWCLRNRWTPTSIKAGVQRDLFKFALWTELTFPGVAALKNPVNAYQILHLSSDLLRAYFLIPAYTEDYDLVKCWTKYQEPSAPFSGPLGINHFDTFTVFIQHHFLREDRKS